MINIINKKDFVDAINDIRNVCDYQQKLNNFFSKNNVDGYIFQPDCTPTVLRLLHLVFEKEYDDMIEYFCFELDFGKKWTENSVTDAKGKPIKLQTPEDLYDYLCNGGDSE